ncbi:MAG TPA: hypothetical protein PKB09_04290 [Candidatus Saccharibacteria bacterium]|nr:hypothetical protein [Candidatus Saccharibacteria bacterium]
MKKRSNCKVCDKTLIGKQTLFCSVKCKNSVHQSYSAQKKRGIERKLFFVNKLGNKCSQCGYSANLSGLAFHHLGGKEFQLDVRSLSNRKIDPIIEEVAKCILLCHNCHAEVHNPGLDLAKLLIEPTALTPELHPLVRTDVQLTQNK